MRGRFSRPLSTCSPPRFSQVNLPLNSRPALTQRSTFAAPIAALYSSGLANVAVPFSVIRIISFEACRRRLRPRPNAQHERSAAIRLCNFGSWISLLGGVLPHPDGLHAVRSAPRLRRCAGASAANSGRLLPFLHRVQDRPPKHRQAAAWLTLIFSDNRLCRWRRSGRGRRDGEGDPGIPA
jgi:hypothetical protein